MQRATSVASASDPDGTLAELEVGRSATNPSSTASTRRSPMWKHNFARRSTTWTTRRWRHLMYGRIINLQVRPGMVSGIYQLAESRPRSRKPTVICSRPSTRGAEPEVRTARAAGRGRARPLSWADFRWKSYSIWRGMWS